MTHGHWPQKIISSTSGGGCWQRYWQRAGQAKNIVSNNARHTSSASLAGARTHGRGSKAPQVQRV